MNYDSIVVSEVLDCELDQSLLSAADRRNNSMCENRVGQEMPRGATAKQVSSENPESRDTVLVSSEKQISQNSSQRAKRKPTGKRARNTKTTSVPGSGNHTIDVGPPDIEDDWVLVPETSEIVKINSRPSLVDNALRLNRSRVYYEELLQRNEFSPLPGRSLMRHKVTTRRIRDKEEHEEPSGELMDQIINSLHSVTLDQHSDDQNKEMEFEAQSMKRLQKFIKTGDLPPWSRGDFEHDIRHVVDLFKSSGFTINHAAPGYDSYLISRFVQLWIYGYSLINKHKLFRIATSSQTAVDIAIKRTQATKYEKGIGYRRFLLQYILHRKFFSDELLVRALKIATKPGIQNVQAQGRWADFVESIATRLGRSTANVSNETKFAAVKGFIAGIWESAKAQLSSFFETVRDKCIFKGVSLVSWLL